MAWATHQMLTMKHLTVAIEGFCRGKIRYIHLHLSESLVGVISRQGNQERIKGLSQEAFVQTLALAGFSRRSCHVYGDRMGKKE